MSLDVSKGETPKGETMDQVEAKHLFEPTGDFQCLHEFIPAARAKLSDHIWDYLVGATETETTTSTTMSSSMGR